MRLLSSPSAGLFADTVNDADSTRKVYLLAGGLVALGIALIAITLWFWRNTRHDPDLLGPLEVMGARRFRKLDGRARQQLLDESRPSGAEPMKWGVDHGVGAPKPEIVDLRALGRVQQPAGYDDLREDAVPVPAPLSVIPVAGSGATDVSADGTSDALAPSTDVDAAHVGSGSTVDDAVGPAAASAADSNESDDASVASAGERTSDKQPTLGADTEAPISPADGWPVVSAEAATAADDDSADATAETEVDEFAILDAIGVGRAGRGAGVAPAKPEPIPLLIVPVDHELGPTPGHAGSGPSRPSPAGADRGRAARSTDAGPVEPEAEPPTNDRPSIDPLLRKFDRDDG